jgi:nitrate/nitrite transporter NarK
LLYILYSLPNVVICIFGGALIDKFKARTIMVLTIVILTIGQAIFTWGGYQNVFSIMLIGMIEIIKVE